MEFPQRDKLTCPNTQNKLLIKIALDIRSQPTTQTSAGQQRELRPNQSPKRDPSGKAEPRQNQIKKPDPPQTKESRYHDSQTLCLSNPYNTSFEIIG